MQPYNNSFPMFTPYQYQNNGIRTHVVDDFNNISANSVPMDNYGAYFAKRDGSEIQLRKWTPEGKISFVRYTICPDMPLENQSEENVLLDKINGLFDRIDALEQLLSKKPTTRTKKEVVKDE